MMSFTNTSDQKKYLDNLTLCQILKDSEFIRESTRHSNPVL